MSRIETGTHAAQALQASVTVARYDKAAGKRPTAAGPVQQTGAAMATIRVRSDFAQLQTINDRQNRVASQLRSDDRQLSQSDQILGQMKRVLTDIIKYYPPYPAGETERVKFLRSFSSMRQQIEQMTIPPEETWKGRMPGDPLPLSETIQTGSPSGGAAATVPGFATTFGIPELQDAADNASIETTLDHIDQARTTIAERRTTMAEQTPSINQSVGYGAKTEELNRTSPETWDLVLPAEGEVEQKSLEAGSGLEQAPDSGITKTDMQGLLQSLAG